MDILLKFQCQGCDKEFMVLDEQIETDLLACPHCQECVDCLLYTSPSPRD